MRKIDSLEEVKSIEFQILSDVHDFCEEFGLHYVLAYGTLIGAIRHNGFIPWDDDIDIWMPRADYDLFERQFPEWGRKRHLYIAGPNSEQHYIPRHFMKVCDDRTLLLEKKYKDYNSLGIFIDIFPLDNATDNSIVRSIWTKYVWTYKYRVLAKNIDLNSAVYKNFSPTKKAITRLLRFGDIKRINSKFIKKASRYINRETGHAVVFYVQKPEILEKKDIFPSRLHIFENRQFYIPKDSDKILKYIYGDYMKLPPENERVPIHTSEAYRL
ncbi:MAG: LicD family protein [Saccharofermentans sp.]|nr:LicD family protein [Saccharofermentans sp.]